MKARVRPRIDLEGRTRLQDVIPLATPFVLFVDPSSICNFQCAFCPTGDRKLIRSTGRHQALLEYGLFRKIIDELHLFEQKIKVLRLYKDGEPLLNPDLAKMVKYSKSSGRVPRVDTTTNGSLIAPERMGPLLEAGLDRINISVDGMTREQYRSFTKFEFDFERFVKNVRWLYSNRGRCEVVIKVPRQLITKAQEQRFYEIFGGSCDRIFVENFAPCWPEFDVEARTGVEITEGIFHQKPADIDVCPYIFYSMSVNAGGEVSACFLDWSRRLLVGDARSQSLKEIWDSKAFNRLRIRHLKGGKGCCRFCSACGQLAYCLADNIDPYRRKLLHKMSLRSADADAPAD